MALFGVAPEVMRPPALVLNIIVASFTSFRFYRVGLFRWRTLWPFLIGAIPLGFIGGAIVLPTHLYRPLVGLILFVAAARFLWPKIFPVGPDLRDPPIIPAIGCGALIGLLSGLTGTGGGIFLSPLLLFMGWFETRIASGVNLELVLLLLDAVTLPCSVQPILPPRVKTRSMTSRTWKSV